MVHSINKWFVIILSLMAFNCAKVDPVTGEKILIDPNPSSKAKKAVEEGGGIFGNIMKGGKPETNAVSFSNSNVLWKATLKSLEFLPLSNTDYRGGVIIYDWYSGWDNSNEQIKITIKFLSDELRSDSIEVLAHKRFCDSSNKCSNLNVDRKFIDEIKNTIIVYARNIKIEETKKIKNQ